MRGKSLDLLGSLSTWRWRGDERLQVSLKDARFAHTP